MIEKIMSILNNSHQKFECLFIKVNIYNQNENSTFQQVRAPIIKNFVYYVSYVD